MKVTCFFHWNELSGSGVGTRVTASQNASEHNRPKNIVQKSYEGVESKPLIIAPGGFFDADWFKEFVADGDCGRLQGFSDPKSDTISGIQAIQK
ncbi:putative glycosidase [Helianthus anomalus]